MPLMTPLTVEAVVGHCFPHRGHFSASVETGFPHALQVFIVENSSLLVGNSVDEDARLTELKEL